MSMFSIQTLTGCLNKQLLFTSRHIQQNISAVDKCFPQPMLKPMTLEFSRLARKKTICLVSSDNTFVWPGSDPKSIAIHLSPIPTFSLWVKKTGQEFLALEVCLVTQRTREGPCVAFNSLHCLPKAYLGQAYCSRSVNG